LIFHKGACITPDRYAVSQNENTVMYMPCFANGVIGTKMLTEIPENPKKGLPYLSGLMILNDGTTGEPLAILNGQTLTALRTGAVGGVAIKHFSKETASAVGLCGCGVQGLHQLMYACSVRNIKNIYLYDGFLKDYSNFKERLEKAILPKKVTITTCKDTTELLEKSEILISATQAVSPLYPNDRKLLKGKCFVAIGSWKPNMRELPDAIWDLVENVYTELPFACEESGDLSQPLAEGRLSMSRVKYIGDYLSLKSEGKAPQIGETSFYKSVGMGLFDLMAAQMIYEKAKEKNIGNNLSL
ncbi:MAG: ornithine cyclodeaminase family protein, partial [Oscillospiraceae bacterium]